jgi:hypothetical protein
MPTTSQNTTCTLSIRCRLRGTFLRALLGLSVFVGLPAAEFLPAPLSRLGQQLCSAQVRNINDVKSLLTQTLPTNAQELSQAASTARAGETITIRGYITNSKDAFGRENATFVLTPTPDVLASAGQSPVPSAIINVLDAQGKPLSGSLSGKHGLKAGAEVFATGKVQSAAEGTLTMTLSSMHVPRDPLPATLFSAEHVPQASDVSKARAERTFKRGEEVLLIGRVGGSKHPFVAGRLVFTLIGRGLKACNEIPGDNCPEPWDYCCDSRDEILANSVTVQVVNPTGQILRTDLKGRRGITELSELIISGTVSVASDKAVIINASRIWLAPPPQADAASPATGSP